MTATMPTQAVAPALNAGNRSALIALVCAAAVWGWSYIATVWILPEMSTPSLIAGRFLLAGLIMLLIRPKAVLTLGRRHTLAGLGLACCLTAGALLQTQGQLYIEAAQSGFLCSLFVVLTPLVARLLFKTAIAPAVWGAALTATAGLAVISFNGVSLGLGTWLTLGGALGYALQMVLLAQYAERDKVYGLAALQLLGTGALGACWAVPTGFDLPDTGAGWGWLIYLTLMATLGMYAVQTWAQARVSATSAAVVMASEPLFVALFSVLVGSALASRTVVGGLLILAAMYLVISTGRKARPVVG
ncbi:DMT family transporter [Streptomyces sp. NPDC048479]|uniref:DMT family transporter n=1 Tax=Streptomyces sp. NPDC048479 TaxID=3154725 RepID=UPI003446829D